MAEKYCPGEGRREESNLRFQQELNSSPLEHCPLKELSFPSTHRLKTKSDFEKLRFKSKKVVLGNGFFCYFANNKNGHLRLGLSVSKKNGKAVKRNKIKRRLREVIRQSPLMKEGIDLVLVVVPPRPHNDVSKASQRDYHYFKKKMRVLEAEVRD